MTRGFNKESKGVWSSYQQVFREPPPYYIRLPGIIGFTGISIPINPTEALSNISDWDSFIDFCMGLDHFYMGFAVGVAVQYENEIH